MKMAGVIMVAFGCAWGGFQACEDLRSQLRELGQMITALRLMRQELERDCSGLKRIMAHLEQRTAGAARQLFSGCRLGLEHLDCESFSNLWRRLVGELQPLGTEGMECLLSLGDTLGQCGCDIQCQRLEEVCLRLEELRSRTREVYRTQGNLYRVMGLSAGAFLITLLL